jgi:hypothetical protein
MTEIFDWLKTKAPGFDQLSDAELSAISGFSMLWTLFEARLLNTEGSAGAVRTVVAAWQRQGTLDAASVDGQLAYFRERYFARGALTDHFDHLQLRENDQPALVRAVIEGNNNDPSDRVAAVLIIIFRYRNNLFHGVKWRYRLAGQLGNFTAANAVLMTMLDQHGALLEE